MNNRYNKLGIKQTIQIHWMDYTVNMLLAGLSEKDIRNELDHYLTTQRRKDTSGERGDSALKMIRVMLSAWYSPDPEIIQIRDRALDLARNTPESKWLPLHWGVISASYPLWFNTAKQVGRLFNLQESIKKSQIITRIKEAYGDRESVSRYTRYTLRSFIAWRVLEDTEIRGVYRKPIPHMIEDPQLSILLYEAYLHTLPDGKAELDSILHNPGFFPFQMKNMTGEFIAKNSDLLEVARYSLDNEILKLK